MNHKEYADSLRMIADFFENHTEVPLPYNANEYRYVATSKAQMAVVAQAIGSGKKEYTAGLFHLKRSFGTIVFDAFCIRETVCARKITGYRDVPEKTIAAHQEAIVEWECFEQPLLTHKEPIPIDAPLAQVIRHELQSGEPDVI